jgi:hypothetical protein
VWLPLEAQSAAMGSGPSRPITPGGPSPVSSMPTA